MSTRKNWPQPTIVGGRSTTIFGVVRGWIGDAQLLYDRAAEAEVDDLPVSEIMHDAASLRQTIGSVLKAWHDAGVALETVEGIAHGLILRLDELRLELRDQTLRHVRPTRQIDIIIAGLSSTANTSKLH